MVWGGVKAYKQHPALGGLLAVFGVATVLFNGWNWWTVSQAIKDRETAAAASAPGRGITTGQQQRDYDVAFGPAIIDGLPAASLRR